MKQHDESNKTSDENPVDRTGAETEKNPAARLPPPRLALIAAVSRNGFIGRDNALPWNLPADLRHFKRRTMGKPVVMGRKTWDAIGRALPGRFNLVVTRSGNLQLAGAESYPSLDQALDRAEAWARRYGVDEMMLIGGGELYAQAIGRAARLYITRIELDVDGDVRFPEIDEAVWNCISRVPHPAEGEAPAHSYEVWSRRSVQP